MSIKSMTPEQRRRFIERYLLYPTVALIGVIIVYLIFASPSNEEPKTQSEFNVTVPEAVEEELAESKKSAYAKEQTKQADEDRGAIITLAQKMIGEKREESPEESPTQKVAASREAYRNMNRSVGTFYTTPKVDAEKERMQRELDELKEQLAKSEQSQPSMGVEEQIALMERSYELAAKYSSNGQEVPQVAPRPAEYINGKAQVNSVGAVASTVVSSLGVGHSSVGFNTAVGNSQAEVRNTIAAVVHFDQTITNGAVVRLRLTEEMRVGDKLLPRNSIITGIGKVQGERLQVVILNIDYRGYILPVEIVVLDSDGVEGIHVPNSMEVSALKSIVANMSGSTSSTITIADQSAGDQILTELGTSAIDGVTQYVADKVKEVKVHLKAGHKIMLYQKSK